MDPHTTSVIVACVGLYLTFALLVTLGLGMHASIYEQEQEKDENDSSS